jgi:hypothetical protein
MNAEGRRQAVEQLGLESFDVDLRWGIYREIVDMVGTSAEAAELQREHDALAHRVKGQK